jgi:hypothetical protein
MKFNIDDVVRLNDSSRTNGKIKYRSCYASTLDSGVCDAKYCGCEVREFVFVIWDDGSLISYNENDLVDQKIEQIKSVLLDELNKFDWNKYNGIK